MKTIFGVLALGGVALVLQGCGSGGGSSATTTTTTAKIDATTTTGKIDATTTTGKIDATTTTGKTDATTTTGKADATTTTTTKITTMTTTVTTGTTTKATLPPRTKPMSSKEAAAYLNKLYTGFNAEDDSSAIGVTVTMISQPTTFFGNIFCSAVQNPDTGKYGSCYNGQADCRLSASVVNNQWMIKKEADAQQAKNAIASFGGRQVGYTFNQSMVASKWARCSFIWDGASNNLYNRGCGDGGKTGTCKGPDDDNAFNDRCGNDRHICKPDDDEVKRAVCTVTGGLRPVPPTHNGNPQCVFPGPAFSYPGGQADWKPYTDDTREMAKQRLKYNDGEDDQGPNLEKNNEVVIDAELFMHDVRENPMLAIPAILYVDTGKPADTAQFKRLATQARDDLCKAYGCKQNGGGDIPLVRVDIKNFHKDGPFLPDDLPDNEELTIAI